MLCDTPRFAQRLEFSTGKLRGHYQMRHSRESYGVETAQDLSVNNIACRRKRRRGREVKTAGKNEEGTLAM